MKKVLLALSLLLLNCCNCFADDVKLQGGVVYNVKTAKEKAFEGLSLKLDKTFLKDYLMDANLEQNKEILKTGVQKDDRILMSFDIYDFVKGYVVVYEDKPEYAFYYTNKGYLVAVDVSKYWGSDFPYRVGKYNPVTGNLISIGLYVSDDEQFVYNKKGNLKAHWIDDIGYNAKGKPIAKRTLKNNVSE